MKASRAISAVIRASTWADQDGATGPRLQEHQRQADQQHGGRRVGRHPVGVAGRQGLAFELVRE